MTHSLKYLIIGLEKINLNDYPDLKVLGCNCTGLDHIDLEECKKRNIKIISLKGETKFLNSITPTAEHTIGLILSLMRKIPWSYEEIREGYWHRNEFIGNELKGKTILIVGYGRLGKMISKYAKTFQMKVLTIDSPDKKRLYRLLEKADIVSLHVPLSGNEKYFDERCFWNMKKGSWFINTSRGDIIDEKALLKALKSKKVAGAALDVVSGEPDNINKKLLEYAKENKNLLLTPHLGGATEESMKKTKEFITKKVKKYFIQYENKNKNRI